MCGGGGDDSASREMIQMQKDEADRIAKKEKKRQDDIKKGLQDIKYLFEGGKDITKTTKGKYDWKKNFKAPTGAAAATNKAIGTQVPGLPAGYKYAVIPGTASVGVSTPSGRVAATPAKAITTPQDPLANARAMLLGGGTPSGSQMVNIRAPGESPNGGGNTHRINVRMDSLPRGGGTSGSPNGGGNTPNSNPTISNGGMTGGGGGTTTPGTWGIVGPDGKVYKIGDNIDTTNTVVTGKTKGWQDEFLNKYMQDMINYYQPQVTEQYGKAQDETKYRHAMAGTLSSTANIGNIADLSKQNKIRTGEVTANATDARDKLSDSIDTARDAATAQVYSTEDPTVATDAASRAIKNITAEKPTLTPLGEVFNIATIGAANFLKGATNASNKTAYGLNPTGRNQTVRA